MQIKKKEIAIMWYYLYIDNPNEAFMQASKFMEAIFALRVSGNKDAAVFSRLDEYTGGVHYYFTPSAKSVAVAYGANPCEKPSKQEMGGLLVGDQTIIDRFFK
jgi:hypothetical protein